MRGVRVGLGHGYYTTSRPLDPVYVSRGTYLPKKTSLSSAAALMSSAARWPPFASTSSHTISAAPNCPRSCSRAFYLKWVKYSETSRCGPVKSGMTRSQTSQSVSNNIEMIHEWDPQSKNIRTFLSYAVVEKIPMPWAYCID